MFHRVIRTLPVYVSSTTPVQCVGLLTYMCSWFFRIYLCGCSKHLKQGSFSRSRCLWYISLTGHKNSPLESTAAATVHPPTEIWDQAKTRVSSFLPKGCGMVTTRDGSGKQSHRVREDGASLPRSIMLKRLTGDKPRNRQMMAMMGAWGAGGSPRGRESVADGGAGFLFALGFWTEGDDS